MDEVHVDYDELGDSLGFRISLNKVKQEADGIGSFEGTLKDVLSVWERVFHGHGKRRLTLGAFLKCDICPLFV